MVSACKEAAEQFPAGLKVLVVDDDITCLKILEQMLRKCTYTVTTCSQAKVALNQLREKKGFFDVVLSDVHMPDMDGFKLLELVGLEMDLPVIMMSGDDRKSLVMRGIRHGACDYLIKPIRIEELKNIWQHVVRKRCTASKENELSGSPEDNDQRRHGNDESEYASCVNDGADGGSRTQKKRKDTKEDDDADLDDEPGNSKKQRVVWSVELHQQFVSAVNQLGIDKAVPKRILELMNVPGLTRENVASHLQKFRLYLKRLSGVAQLHGGLPSQFCAPLDSISQVGSTVGRFDIQALAASGQIPPQTLAALHAELLNQPTSTVVLPAMGQSSLPATKCTNLDQNIAYGQPLGKRSSVASNNFSQEFCSADNVQPGLGSWSSKSPISVVNCDNLTGFATNNGGAMIDIMNHQTRELRQPHEHPQRQSAFPEASRTINVQPSCLVASHSSPNFQAGNSFGSANISRSLGGSSNINYNMLMPQSNNPQLDNGRVQDLEIKRASRLGGLSGFGSSSPVRLSSGSLNANNGIGMEVPASRSNGIRPFSALAPNASNFLDSYDAPSANFLDQRMLQSTGFFGGAAPVPSHIHTDETGLTFNHGDRENMYGDNIGNNKVKQEASMTFRENGKGGVPRLSHNECFF